MKANLRFWILSILAGLLLALAFAPFNFSFLAWVGFLPLFFVISRISTKKALFFSYLAGLAFFMVSISWLIQVTLVGWLILCCYLALYFAFFGFLSSFYIQPEAGNKSAYLSLLIVPAIFVALEFLRSHFLTGFGWNNLGYSQFKNLALIQIADFSSVYGVSFFIIEVNLLTWLLLVKLFAQPERQKVRGALFLLFILFLAFLVNFGYAWQRLKELKSISKDGLKVAIIQPNIAQSLKWAPVARNYIFEQLWRLTYAAARESPDMLIWPESAVPDYFQEDSLEYEPVFRLSQELKTYILTGVVRVDQEDNFFNSSLLISKQGKVANFYDKLHLVPYGEFIPFRKVMPFIGTVVGIGDFTAGKDYTIFHLEEKDKVNPAAFAVLICFEDAFPYLSRQFVKRGASFLVNLTNDAWFGNSGQPEQHLSQSVFRAIENRVNLVRCTNSGVSGLIDRRGGIVKLIRDSKGRITFVRGLTTFFIDTNRYKPTFYNRFGDAFAYACSIISLTALLARALRKRCS